MRDRLGAIQVFVAVAEAGSLSAAGRRLGVPLTTVSRRLAALEHELGVRLITRTTRQLALTELGRQYLDDCRRILTEFETAKRRLAGEFGEPQGELALAAPVVLGRRHVLPIVTEFLNASSRVTAHLLLVDRVADLIEERLDLAVRIGVLPNSSLIATRVGSVRYVTCASSAYLKRRGVPRHPKDLVEHDCISYMAPFSADPWQFVGVRRAKGTAVRPRLSINTADAVLEAVRNGLGIARLFSYEVVNDLVEGTLKLVLEDFEPEELPVSIVHQEDRLPQAKVQAFIAFAAPRLRKRLEQERIVGSKRACPDYCLSEHSES